MKYFTETVIHTIKQIPMGQVMTYGQIARIAGSPRAARQVVWVIHSMSAKHNLPWHRVVNAKGTIGIKNVDESLLQKLMLQQEGVAFSSDGLINLDRYLYNP